MANLRPDFPDEASARRAGWRPITSALYLPEERDLALAIAASLSGNAPGSNPVQFCIIGDSQRIYFARPAADLRGLEVEPNSDNHNAVDAGEPMLLPDAA